jgi:cation transport regulator ChaB
MPKTTKKGDAKQSELPSTLQRSPGKAQRTFAKAHDSALDEYGDEQRATRVAWAAVKHSFEKVGDHWERKAGGKRGPSDAQAAGGQGTNRRTGGGVDATATKKHLLELAERLDIPGRTTMKKTQLVEAIQRANDRRTAKARDKEAARAATQGTGGRGTTTRTRGRIDATATKKQLLEMAERLDISGRTTMKKNQLVEAIRRADDRRTAKARDKEAARAATQGTGGRGTATGTRKGLDATASKKQLLELASKLDISGRTTMKKTQLVAAIQRADGKRKARSGAQ